MYSAMVIQKVMQRRWKPWRWEVYWPATGSWQWPTENIIETDPLKTIQEVSQELSIDQSMVVWHLKQIGNVRKLNKWVTHKLTTNQKKLFWSVIFSYSMQQWTISQLDCDMRQKVDFIRQPVTTNSVTGLRSSSKALPKAKLAPKK